MNHNEPEMAIYRTTITTKTATKKDTIIGIFLTVSWL